MPDFKIEIFIPEKKRIWILCLPVLEGAEFIGRIELKSVRRRHALLLKFGLEAGIVLTKSLRRKIEDELSDGKFMALNAVEWVF